MSTPTPRLLVLAASCAATVLTLLPAASPPAAGAAPAADRPTCQGRKATIVGTRHGDFLTGTSGRDVIVGLGGDDKIRGRGGDDVVCGGDGADRISGDGGDDRLDGGRDRVTRESWGSWMDGDQLDGGRGDDRLDVGHDPRRTDGHRTTDAVVYETSARGVRIDLSGRVGRATGQGTDRVVITPTLAVEGSTHDDLVIGSAGEDHVTGNAGDDVVRAGAGDDVVHAETYAARPGDDTVDAGPGDDLVVSLAGRDRILGGPGRDQVDVGSTDPTVVDAGPDDDLVQQAVSTDPGTSVLGGSGTDTVLLRGWARGVLPRPSLDVDLRVGRLSFGAGTGTVGGFEEHRLTGDVAYTFHGTDGPDRLAVLSGGGLSAWTYGGDDWVVGSEHADVLDLGEGTDEVHGGGGADTCGGHETGGC